MLLPAFFFCALNGCGLGIIRCNAKNAERLGRQDAWQWNSVKPGLKEGKTCEGEFSASDFEEAYYSGFRAELKSSCSPGMAFSMGRTDAITGRFNRSLAVRWSLCEEVGLSTKNILMDEYTKGFQSRFCDEANIKNRAETMGKALDDAETSFHDLCPVENNVELLTLYKDAYDEAFRSACTSVSASVKGERDANSNKNVVEMLKKYRKCPESDQSALVLAYRQAYDQTRQRNELLIQEERIKRQLEEVRTAQQEEKRDRRIEASRTTFTYKGHTFKTTCEIVEAENRARVVVSTRDKVKKEFDNWKVEFMDADGHSISSKTFHNSISFYNGGSEDFELYSWQVPEEAETCRAFFKGN